MARYSRYTLKACQTYNTLPAVLDKTKKKTNKTENTPKGTLHTIEGDHPRTVCILTHCQQIFMTFVLGEKVC